MGIEAEHLMHSFSCGRKAEVALEIKALEGRDFSKVRTLNEFTISTGIPILEITIISSPAHTRVALLPLTSFILRSSLWSTTVGGP